jgi:hypothetical protein
MALTGKMFPTVRAAIIIIKVEYYTFASSVDEHSCVHAFNGDEILSALLVFVLVSEDDFGKGGASTSIMNNVSHNSLDVTKDRLVIVNTGAFKNIGQLFKARQVGITYPCLSAKSRVLKRAGATLLQVCALKTLELP